MPSDSFASLLFQSYLVNMKLIESSLEDFVVIDSSVFVFSIKVDLQEWHGSRFESGLAPSLTFRRL